ncbi:MAG: DUF4344 domain-containing metallopeptidase, partial [Pseudomonadota bacterium]
MVVRFFALLALLTLWTGSAAAQDANDAPTSEEEVSAFVENNLLHILYHEAAHAVIDQFGLPVLGQEEDAADAFATVEILNSYEEADALAILADSAIALFIMDERLGDDIEIADYYAIHDLDVQRGFRIICHAVGLDPDTFGGLADEFELSEERAETCEDDGWLAADSWDVLLEPTFLPQDVVSERVSVDIDIETLTDTQRTNLMTSGVMDDFVAYLSETFDWPQPLTVTVDALRVSQGFDVDIDGNTLRH